MKNVRTIKDSLLYFKICIPFFRNIFEHVGKQRYVAIFGCSDIFAIKGNFIDTIHWTVTLLVTGKYKLIRYGLFFCPIFRCFPFEIHDVIMPLLAIYFITLMLVFFATVTKALACT